MRDSTANDSVDLIGKMLDAMQYLVDPENRMPPTTSEIANLSMKLSRDLKMEFTDALILAHALHDPYSTHLITDDRKMLSYKVKEVEMEMRKNGERERRLSTSDNFSHRGLT